AQLTTTRARVPFIGHVYATSLVVSLHQLQHDEARLFGPGRLCTLDLDSGSRWVRTTVPAAVRARLPQPMLDAELGVDERGSRTLRQGRRVVVLGARLARPGDPLPLRPTDPAVLDEDRDGRPGVTIEIGGIVPGRIFVAQRSWTELSGRQLSGASFAGAVRFGNEQVILDATSRRLSRALDAEPVPERSWFRLVRLADEADCSAATAVASSWVAERAP
ncbi:MAG TPA: hypothetical protein VFZ61_31545, partial [Polyangiales bacterium]